jgi:hypothetical protein
MAILPQASLFSWEQLDQLDDLQRLKLVLDALPDEALMRQLEAQRGRGRDDYPVRAMWNSVVAGIVFGHGSIESLRRELCRNAPLRQCCGFDLLQGLDAVANSWNYTRFLKLLMRHQAQLDAMFDTLVKQLARHLPDLGEHMAVDGKAIATHARSRAKDAPMPPGAEADGRRDTDAVWGVKTQRGVKQDGKPWEKITRWFGYKLHLVVDSRYELPLAYTVTKASSSEVVQFRDHLLPQLKKDHPQLLKTCQTFSADKGYDDTKTITTLYDDHAIHPIIDIRDSWQDGKSTRAVPGVSGVSGGRVQYDIKGHVECWSQRDGQRYSMAYGGYEKDRKAHKFRCPARHYGQSCGSLDRCSIGAGSGQVRVPLTVDRRIFTPTARPSGTWRKHYNRRTAVERVNSRIDQSFGFERHFIRGKAKMQLRVSLALLVMLAMAVGRLAHQQNGAIRSLVRPAA